MANFPGTPGNDVYQGGSADDVIEGGTGADTLRGGAGNDRLFGTREFNTYDDGAADQLFGEAGNDFLLIQAGDSADGGDGDDIIDVRGDVPVALVGGSGTDTLRVNDGVNIAGSSISGIERLEAITGGNQGTQLTAAQLSLFTTIGAIGGGSTVYLALTGGGSGVLRLDPAIATARVDGSTAAETLSMAAGSTARLDYRGGTGAATVTGGNAADSLEGGTGADILRGGAGNDRLFGTREFNTYDDGAADQLFGEAGNDFLLIQAGDSADGGDGDDMLVGSTGNEKLTGGAGSDTASYERSSAAVTVDLTKAAAQVTGGGGTDTLSGIENLIGGSGADTLTGDGGANVLEGLRGNDKLNGAGGGDTASYSRADEAVRVDLRLAAAQDTLGAGIDTLTAIENLTGSAHDDTLTGNAGDNVIEGGAGDDLLDGQGGKDTASYAGAGAAVTVSLAVAARQNTRGAGSDTLKGFENLRGSAFNDKLTGDGAANTLEGGAGSDTLTGGAGNDTLAGGAGNDTYVWDGTDSIVEAATTAGGVDLVQSALAHTLSAGVEKLTLIGSAAVNGTGNSLDNTLTGNGANNTLSGLGGKDVLSGGAGNDTLIGGDGDDTYIWDGTDSIVEAATTAGGIDLVQAALTHTLGTGVERLTLTGSAAVNGTGNGLGNTLTGNGGANTLKGLDGTDVLIGGGGKDLLDGGLGADTFRFLAATDSSADAPDTIVLFDAPGTGAGDRIDLSGIDANTLTAGNGTFAFGSTDAGGLSLVSQGASTLIRGNTDGDATFEFAILITDGATAHTRYTQDDFML